LLEDASGATIVDEVTGASHAAKKPSRPIKIASFFITILFLLKMKVINKRFSLPTLQMRTNPMDLNYTHPT